MTIDVTCIVLRGREVLTQRQAPGTRQHMHPQHHRECLLRRQHWSDFYGSLIRMTKVTTSEELLSARHVKNNYAHTFPQSMEQHYYKAVYINSLQCKKSISCALWTNFFK